RGVVLSAARIDAAAGALAWLGVGNVEGVLSLARPAASRRSRDRERLIPDAGVLGSRLPPLHPRALPLEPGDLLIFATDGVDIAFADERPPSGSPREIAKRLLATHGRSTDDALVLAVRYLGPTDGASPA
ncbi:MAG: SpoIIE family protein phosphatase, partial [Gemmatimonadota bacterium]